MKHVGGKVEPIPPKTTKPAATEKGEPS
jgi:hypothetical protein